MIYTVTLSPSIDYIVRMSNMRSNTTNRTDSEEFYFGGKGINVSQVLAELDLDSIRSISSPLLPKDTFYE